MHLTHGNTILGRALGALILAGVLLGSTAQAASAGGQSGGAQASLSGTWGVQVTLRNCLTDAPLGPAFASLVTFHEGGTLSETAGSTAFAAGQRSSGHGTWERTGRRTYEQKMIALILFDTPANLPGTPGFNPALPVSPGFSAGWQTVTHTLKLVDANHATSSGTNEFFKTNGEMYRTGCSTAVAERFE